MQQSQLNNLTGLITQYKKFNLNKVFANIYIKQKDISSITIGEYTVPEIIKTSKRIIKQLEKELNSDAWKHLPIQNNCNNEYGTGSLTGDLQNLISSFNDESLHKIPFYLNRLICYQIQNGFWDKKLREVPTVKEEELNNLKSELEIISTHLKEYSKQSVEIIENLKDEKTSLFDDLINEKQIVTKFMKQKSKELQAIESDYQSSRKLIEEINDNRNAITKTTTEIDNILGNVQEEENEIKETLKKANKNHTEYKENIIELIEQVNDSIKEFDQKDLSFKEKLNYVEDKMNFFDDKLKEAQEITGFYTSAKMSQTFKDRKDEINPSVKKWLWIVIIMSTLSFAAVIAIFTNFFGLMEGGLPIAITTSQLISNSIKTLPFFFLLYYAISQYNKERNFQEEYAFKSSIAITLNAFADLTGKLKEEFIVDSVTNIYQSPIRYRKTKDKATEDIVETTKELLLNTAKKASDNV